MSINVLLMAFFYYTFFTTKNWANFRNAPSEKQISPQTDVSDALYFSPLSVCCVVAFSTVFKLDKEETSVEKLIVQNLLGSEHWRSPSTEM